MLAVAKKERRAADGSITVAAIMNALEGWLSEAEDDRHIKRHFSDKCAHVGWKTAPEAKSLAAMASLYVRLARVARNGALPPKKTEQALFNIDADRRANFTSLNSTDWASEVGGVVRMVFGKYVDLLKQSAYMRCMKKATRSSSPKVCIVVEVSFDVHYKYNVTTTHLQLRSGVTGC